MPFDILLKPSAEKSFSKLPKSEQIKVFDVLEQLAVNPLPNGVKKLKSTESLYRIRVGDYRVIYSIQNKILTVTILKIGHRSDVYR